MALFPTPVPLSDPSVLQRALANLLDTDWTFVQAAAGLPGSKASLGDLASFIGRRGVTLESKGAVGNGVTDDYAAFVAAKNAAGVGGYVRASKPNATYLLNTSFDFDVAGQTWDFTGTTVKAGATIGAVSGHVVRANAVNTIDRWGRIINLTVDGNASAQSVITRGLRTTTDYWIIERPSAFNVLHIGMIFDSISNIYVINPRVWAVTFLGPSQGYGLRAQNITDTRDLENIIIQDYECDLSTTNVGSTSLCLLVRGSLAGAHLTRNAHVTMRSKHLATPDALPEHCEMRYCQDSSYFAVTDQGGMGLSIASGSVRVRGGGIFRRAKYAGLEFADCQDCNSNGLIVEGGGITQYGIVRDGSAHADRCVATGFMLDNILETGIYDYHDTLNSVNVGGFIRMDASSVGRGYLGLQPGAGTTLLGVQVVGSATTVVGAELGDAQDSVIEKNTFDSFAKGTRVTANLKTVDRIHARDNNYRNCPIRQEIGPATNLSITQIAMTSVTTPTATTIVASAGSWISQGLNVNDTIFLSGFPDAANNGVNFLITALSANTITVNGPLVVNATPDTSFSVNRISVDLVVTQTSMTSVTTPTANTIVASGGSWITQGLNVNDRIRLATFLDAANNNKDFVITALTASTITVDGTLVVNATPNATFSVTRFLFGPEIFGIMRRQFISATAFTRLVTNGAANFQLELPTNKTILQGWAFNDSTVQYVQIAVDPPEGWDRGAIGARFRWTSQAAGSGSVGWGLAALALADGDAWDVALTLSGTVLDVFQGSNKEHITDVTNLLTPGGLLRDRDKLILQVSRSATNAGDTLVGDAVFTGLDLEWSLIR
jgi:hypothetical protein